MHDPAFKRLMLMHMTRLLGVGFVVVGILVTQGRLFPAWPQWVGYLLLVNGLVDVFLLPRMMARKWRSPQ